MGLPPEQAAGARSVLNAAAMTYVAAALVAIMQFVYFLGLSRRN
jgi:Zn-dependent membrane protease YugP